MPHRRLIDFPVTSELSRSPRPHNPGHVISPRHHQCSIHCDPLTSTHIHPDMTSKTFTAEEVALVRSLLHAVAEEQVVTSNI